jgi:hypothetical protein
MPKEKNDLNLNLNINKDDSQLNDFLFCWKEFSKRPNKITIHSNYSTKLFKDFVDERVIESNTFTEIIPDDEEMIINDKILAKLSDDIYLAYIVIDRELDTSLVSDIVFYYKSEKNLPEIQNIVDGINKCMIDFCEEESKNLNTLSLSSSGLEIEPLSLDYDFDNFELYFNNKTIKNLNKTIKKVKKNERGLVLLYGERGVGKTSTIKYIADNLDRIVIFIPNSLIEHTINNSDFRKFLRKYSKPVLVLDDCEMIFNDYFSKSNMIVNNLLQIVDGLIYDDVTVVAIFNVEDESEIDHTLLESNNLVESIDFEYLSSEEAEELSKYLGSNKKYKNDIKMIDVLKKRNSNKNKHIGF